MKKHTLKIFLLITFTACNLGISTGASARSISAGGNCTINTDGSPYGVFPCSQTGSSSTGLNPPMATASGQDSIAIGWKANTTTDYSIGLGAGTYVTGAEATALGAYSSASADNGVALGNHSSANVSAGSIGYISNGQTSSTWISTAGAVSVGDTTNNITRQITSVAAGTADTDAVNVAQLKAVNNKIENNFNVFNNRLNDLNEDISITGAAAGALAALKPLQYDPLQKLQVMAGFGNYKGKTAGAFGLAYHVNENVMLNIGTSINSHSNIVNAGIAFKFGRSQKERDAIPEAYQDYGAVSSIYKLQQENAVLQSKMIAQEKLLEAQQKQINYLMRKIK